MFCHLMIEMNIEEKDILGFLLSIDFFTESH
jgi:hypothetical protein